MSEWLPIETFRPPTGTAEEYRFDLFAVTFVDGIRHSGERLTDCWVTNKGVFQRTDEEGYSGGIEFDKEQYFHGTPGHRVKCVISHWMPLPNDPA